MFCLPVLIKPTEYTYGYSYSTSKFSMQCAHLHNYPWTEICTITKTLKFYSKSVIDTFTIAYDPGWKIICVQSES